MTFDADGKIINRIYKPNRNEHLAELKFVNTKFLELIDTILKRSLYQPVIIFQADHGSTDGTVRGPNYRRLHFDVYSAYYIPDRHSLEIPQPHTTINTFPLILNSVFDAGLEYRENRLYEVSKTTVKPLEQKEVTESFANWLN